MNLLTFAAITVAAVTLVCYAFYCAGRLVGWREGSADGFDRGLEEGLGEGLFLAQAHNAGADAGKENP